MAEIYLEGVTKIFDHSIVALDNFSLKVKDKEFVTILGPSGSGKSTVLRIISGLEKQDRGDVFIERRLVNNLSPQERDVAFVFQSYALYPHMDVEENIAVGLRLKGYPSGEIKKRVSEVAKVLEITDLLKRRPKTLSGGQRQRVALARAIAKRPKVFLLDEPLSNLDATLREKMRAELKLLFKRIGGTVIYVTHDQAEAMSLADRIALIEKGKLMGVETGDELYFHPKNIFVASFLGSPRINIFEVEILDKNFIYGSFCWQIPETWHSKLKNFSKLIIGIRPEDINVYLEAKSDAFPVQLIMTEKMGKYTILNLNWQGKILKALVESKLTHKINSDRIWIKFNEERLYPFDTNTEELIK